MKTYHEVNIKGRNYLLSHKPVNEECIKVVEVNGVTHVGYLVQDEDCENPMDADGMGHIYDARRNCTRESKEGYRNALGIDIYGQPDSNLTPNPHAVLLDVYSHSGEVYNIHGEGYICRWDTSSNCACWIPDKYCQEAIEAGTITAIAACRDTLKTFNAWLSGECYGVVVEKFEAGKETPVDDDSCWGYVGYDYALECISENMPSEMAMA